MPKQKPAEPIAWSQLQTILKASKADIAESNSVADAQIRLIVALGCYFGLRAGDLLSLRWVQVTRTDSFTLQEGKTGKTRKIEINDDVKKIIEFTYKIVAPENTNELLITHTQRNHNEPLSVQFFNRRLRAFFKKYGISDTVAVSSHTLRKTFGKRVYEKHHKSEDALVLLSQIFRHKDISTTRRYIGLTDQIIKEVYLDL